MRISVLNRFFLLLAVTCGGLALFWLGCATTSCEETLDCAKVGGGPDAVSPDVTGPDAGPDAPPAVLDGCVTANAPKDDGCVLQDPIGVFVSPTGNDSAEGTAEKPLLTVTRAVAVARLANKSSIFVCGGAYTSSVEVTPGPGVSIYGGLACPSGKWKYDGTLARFAPTAMPQTGAVLLVDQLATTTTVSDLEIVAPTATAPGASSVAAFVRNCPAVKLDRVTFRAGDGAPGGNGQNGAFTDTNRTAGSNNAGGSVTCQCTVGGATTGAGGGAGGAGATGGGSGSPALGALPPKNGAGGAAGCTAGAEGADGTAGTAGALAAQTTLGTLTAMGWQSAAAVRAGNGGTAQGGGGGGGTLLGGGGGGGGCGGCGGQGATSGGQGGSSVGLLVFQSTVATDGCTIVTGGGGKGGTGGGGQAGQSGGGAGTGACGGGKGGTGGAGGGGGGGLGGNAFGVAYKGQAPMGQPKITTGGFGPAGTGGTSPTPESAGKPGVPGVTAATQQLP